MNFTIEKSVYLCGYTCFRCCWRLRIFRRKRIHWPVDICKTGIPKEKNTTKLLYTVEEKGLHPW